MKRFIPLLLLTLLTQAQAAYGTLELYPSAVQRSVSVQVARNELTQARAEVARLAADPLALQPARMAADARARQAEAGVRLSELQLRATLAGELEALSGAEYGARLAQARRELADLRLTAAQVKFRAGALTKLDLDAAQAEASNAAAAVATAEATLNAARQKVQGRAGTLPRLPLQFAPAPEAGILRAALANHPRLIKASAEVAAADLDLQVKSTDLSAAAEVKAARVALENARTAQTEARLELEAALTAALQTYQSAQSTLAPAERSTGAAASQAATAEKRFAAGLISRAALLQARLEALEARSTLDGRQAATETALASLSVAANLNVWK
ncbi:TolC family protein [Deinococcus enclensis]|uniref:Outer membrane protein TolC n=1 Tax=Deinococcus enclensis TaxID=1049582 RepID=A0ABT9MF75_9DEIO|nr:TolC family protein [Deinococcus enclensis]MDP9765262.1 outer membrane protein TolC [Deinococcus enclensis]